MADTAQIVMFRYDPSVDAEPRYATYDVPVPTDQTFSILKALHYINDNVEPIGYDYTCRCDFCGRCGMLVNGTPGLACSTPCAAGESYTVEPLPGYPVVKDLVVDQTKVYNRLVSVNVSRKALMPLDCPPDHEQAGLWWEDMKDLNCCRECGICYSQCPVLQIQGKWSRYIGPAAMMQIAQRWLDPNDTSDRLRQAVECGVFQCIGCGACTETCPAGIKITELNARMQQAAIEAGLQPAAEETTQWPMML